MRPIRRTRAVGSSNSVARRFRPAWIPFALAIWAIAHGCTSSPRDFRAKPASDAGEAGVNTLADAGSFTTAGEGGAAGVGGRDGVTTDAGSAGMGGQSNEEGAGSPGETGGASMALDDSAPCSSNGQCSSAHCVDGVCCDSSCSGQCESCHEFGSVGKCSVVASGVPRGQRTACAGSGPCIGACDGSNGKACKYAGNSTVCTPATCANGKVSTASVCNGAGACTAADSGNCAANVCATDGSVKCATSCSATSCGAGSYCDPTGVCLPLKANGTACSIDAQCTYKHCADGFCCDSACTGQCQACSSSGTCTRVIGAPHGSKTPCSGSGQCAGQCDGTLDNQCAYPGSSTVCKSSSCSTDLTQARSASVCNAGTCTMSMTTTCGATNYCGGGACVVKLASGAACTSNVQCASGSCSNGEC